MKDYKINRPEAAKIIGVSLRTLDRYVLKGEIKYKKIKGRVLFSFEDLENLKTEKNTEIIDEVKTSFDFTKNKKENETFPIFNSSFQDQNSNLNLLEVTRITSERDTYKKMYELIFSELKEKQDELQKVNFRLGELITKQNLPQIEAKKDKEEIRLLKEKIKEDENLLKKIKEELSFQKFIKTVFVIFLVLTISLLSFWYFYNFKI